jgi:hypothetical protein
MPVTRKPVTTRIEVTVYTRDQCHLCEALRDEIEAFRQRCPTLFEITWIDIDSSDSLVRRYGHKVPVVAIGSTQICHFFFDQPALQAELNNRSPCPPAHAPKP